jgi:hypothetical protein
MGRHHNISPAPEASTAEHAVLRTAHVQDGMSQGCLCCVMLLSASCICQLVSTRLLHHIAPHACDHTKNTLPVHPHAHRNYAEAMPGIRLRLTGEIAPSTKHSTVRVSIIHLLHPGRETQLLQGTHGCLMLVLQNLSECCKDHAQGRNCVTFAHLRDDRCDTMSLLPLPALRLLDPDVLRPSKDRFPLQNVAMHETSLAYSSQ